MPSFFASSEPPTGGHECIPPSCRTDLLGRWPPHCERLGVGGVGVTLLTEREREILACAASGRGNKDIADQLCVSADTVKTHLHHIYCKLGVAGRVEAILTYLNSK